MSHPFEEFPSSNYYFLPAKYAENGLGHESPRTIAKNVIERLSQSHGIPKTNPKGFDNSMPPITVGDIHDRSSDERYGSKVNVIPQKFYSVNEPSEAINRNNMESSGLYRQNLINHSEVLNLAETERMWMWNSRGESRWQKRESCCSEKNVTVKAFFNRGQEFQV